MRRRFIIFCVGIAVTLWPTLFPVSAFGQGETWVGASLAQMVEAAHWRSGPLRVNAALELTNAGYDSDIYFGYLNETWPDFTFSAALPVQLLLPLSKKVVLDLFESPQYVFYNTNENERGWNDLSTSISRPEPWS